MRGGPALSERAARVEGWLAPILVGTILIGASYASAWLPSGASRLSTWLMIVGAALVMSGTLALGARRSHVRTPIVVGLAVFLFVVIVTGFGAPLLLPTESANSPLFLGLPIRAAIEIYGVGLLPFLVLPWVFAKQFDAAGLDPASLDGLRAECEQLRHASESTARAPD